MRSCLQDGHLLWTHYKCHSPWLGKTLHQWSNLLLEKKPASWDADFMVTGNTVAWLSCHLQIPENRGALRQCVHTLKCCIFTREHQWSSKRFPLPAFHSNQNPKDSRVGYRTLYCQHSGGGGRNCRGSRPVGVTQQDPVSNRKRHGYPNRQRSQEHHQRGPGEMPRSLWDLGREQSY